MNFKIAKTTLIFGSLLASGCAYSQAETDITAQSIPTEERAVATERGVANPAIWPKYKYPVEMSAQQQARIDGLIAKMTLPEKVGQLVQADLCCVTPEDVKKYNLGSVLNGGSSGPYGDDFAPAPKWLEAADEFYAASTDKSDGGVGIPLVWGTDAVHGHSNIIGATLFPHNIGLGAMRDTALIEKIGAATAKEIRVTGQEWTFAPTVAVPQDFRWGRAYEGYSSNPSIVAEYTGAMVRGLQGPADGQNLLDGPYVIASTKHYLADGGTDNGVDQGDANISEEELRDIHGAPYGPAITEGVATVMASFSSWQGKKMTGSKSLLTDVLRDRMGFDGFVVSDWNAHGQVAGCTNSSCPQALTAGIDMYMAPDTWKAIYEDTLAKAQSGEIPMARIDSAVDSILKVKMRLGLLDAPKPSDRLLSGQYDLLGNAEHRAIAREAVRKSLVLLKNQGVLPLKSNGHLLVAGEGANDIARQSGGWTISWQGTGLDNSHFPGATSLYTGLADAFKSSGGSSELSPDGSFTKRPDVAVVVFGEKPYAEFQGDRSTLALDDDLTGPYATMRKLKEQGIPVVAVMITGRPLYVNTALNLADAFVVTWLPGSEGGGLADVIVGDTSGNARFDFAGKLPTAWPRTPDINDGALFDFGFSLNYSSASNAWTDLPEVDVSAAGDSRVWFATGTPASSWSLLVRESLGSEEKRLTTVPAEALSGRVKVTAENFVVQEGARRFKVEGGQTSTILRNFEAIDLDKETNGDVLMLVTAKVWKAPQTALLGSAGNNSVGLASVNLPVSEDFVRYGIPLRCIRSKGADMRDLTMPFVLQTTGPTDYAIGEVRLGTDAEQVLPCK